MHVILILQDPSSSNSTVLPSDRSSILHELLESTQRLVRVDIEAYELSRRRLRDVHGTECFGAILALGEQVRVDKQTHAIDLAVWRSCLPHVIFNCVAS